MHSYTSNLDKLYTSEAYVTFRCIEPKAMAEKSTTVSIKREINSAGSISDTQQEGIGMCHSKANSTFKIEQG